MSNIFIQCINTLSVNQQMPNGAIPDVVLPFKLTKAEAKEQISSFVRKRKKGWYVTLCSS